MTGNPYEPPQQDLVNDTLHRRRHVALVSLSLLAYLSSFFMSVFDAGTPQVMVGYQAFAFALVSKFLPTWLANPAYWFACYQTISGNIRLARNCAIAAVVVSLSQIWMLDDTPEVGFYVWTGSILFLAISLALVVAMSTTATEPDSHER